MSISQQQQLELFGQPPIQSETKTPILDPRIEIMMSQLQEQSERLEEINSRIQEVGSEGNEQRNQILELTGNVKDGVEKYGKRVLRGLDNLRTSGSGFTNQCMPPRSPNAVFTCFVMLVVFLFQVMYFLLIMYWGLIKTTSRVGGTVGRMTPLIGGMIGKLIEFAVTIIFIVFTLHLITYVSGDMINGPELGQYFMMMLYGGLKSIFKGIWNFREKVYSDLGILIPQEAVDDFNYLRQQLESSLKEQASGMVSTVVEKTSTELTQLPSKLVSGAWNTLFGNSNEQGGPLIQAIEGGRKSKRNKTKNKRKKRKRNKTKSKKGGNKLVKSNNSINILTQLTALTLQELIKTCYLLANVSDESQLQQSSTYLSNIESEMNINNKSVIGTTYNLSKNLINKINTSEGFPLDMVSGMNKIKKLTQRTKQVKALLNGKNIQQMKSILQIENRGGKKIKKTRKYKKRKRKSKKRKSQKH